MYNYTMRLDKYGNKYVGLPKKESTQDYLPEALRIKIKEELSNNIDKILDKYSYSYKEIIIDDNKTDIFPPQYTLDKSITFEEYCQKYIKVWNNVKVDRIPFKLTSNQHKTYSYIENNKFSIINQYRQAGLTTLLSNYSVYKALSTPNITIGYFGVSKNHLRDVFKHIVPFELECSVKRQTVDLIEFYNGSKIMFKILTENALIGINCDLIILDNYAFFNYNNIIESLISRLKPNGSIIISSTPKKDSNFNKICIDAYEDKNDFKYLKLNWFDDEIFNQNIKIDINGVKKNDWSTKILNHSGKERFEEEVLGLVL